MAITVLTLKDLRDQCLYWLDEAGDTGTTKTVLNNALNQAHRLRCASYPWPFMLWDAAETLTITAGTQLYTLHQQFDRPYYFFDTVAENYLVEVPTRALEDIHPADTVQSQAGRFMFWGRTPVAAQPSSASKLALSSSSASDTGATYAVTIKGMTSTGFTSESITPSGVTPVASSGTYTKILNVTKAAAWNGTLTLTSNSAAVTNLNLDATEYGRSYQQIWLLDNPMGTTVSYRFFRQPSALTADYDVPDIPPPYTEILVWDALILMAGYNTDLRGESLAVWTNFRDRIETAMQQSLAEGTTVGAMPKYIRYMDSSGHDVEVLA